MSSSGLPKRSGVRILGSQVQAVVVLVHVDSSPMKTFRQLLLSPLPGSAGRVDCTETARETLATPVAALTVSPRGSRFNTCPASGVLRAGRYNRVRVQPTLWEMRRSHCSWWHREQRRWHDHG
jgi:hypothetical protein